MNHGILKLFKFIFIVLFFIGCAKISENWLFFGDEKPIKQEKVVEQNKTIKSEPIKKKTPIIESKKIPSKNIVIKEKKIKEEAPKSKLLKISTTLDKNNLKEFAFDLIQKGTIDNNTLLIVGGIQGDEPGGFMAASLISTHYEITKGSVWIVPNLNFYGIIKRSRGPFGDMNRKFANLSKDDPEYEIIQRIKKYISDPSVKLILNLHDGSGYYRPMYIDNMHQPRRWGQTVVIDQEIVHNVEKYNDLYTIANRVINHTNKHLLRDEDKYRIKNTHTRFERTFVEKEMAKTLTFYAINQGKAAFGHETSKSLVLNDRVYYKLLAIEKFMDIMGIEYKRKFDLSIAGVASVLEDDIDIEFEDTKIKMPLKDIRNIQRFFPIDENGVVKYLPSNPLIKIIKNKNYYTIYYGNRVLTKLQADYSKHLSFETKIKIDIDGKVKNINFGDTINVKNYFNVLDDTRYRVNVIGYKSKINKETGQNIKKSMFIRRYSVQKHGDLYRIEFYKGKKFAGMVLVNYEK